MSRGWGHGDMFGPLSDARMVTPADLDRQDPSPVDLAIPIVDLANRRICPGCKRLLAPAELVKNLCGDCGAGVEP